LFSQGAYVIGEVIVVTKYQSQEDKSRNRPVHPGIDYASGLPLFNVTIADPSAEKDRDKPITVEIAARVQPVPSPAVSFGGAATADGTASSRDIRAGKENHLDCPGNRHACGGEADRQQRHRRQAEFCRFR
jgi:hypothetical protein